MIAFTKARMTKQLKAILRPKYWKIKSDAETKALCYFKSSFHIITRHIGNINPPQSNWTNLIIWGRNKNKEGKTNRNVSLMPFFRSKMEGVRGCKRQLMVGIIWYISDINNNFISRMSKHGGPGGTREMTYARDSAKHLAYNALHHQRVNGGEMWLLVCVCKEIGGKKEEDLCLYADRKG